MLLYFACHPDPVEGVYRALSIASGTYIHRKKEASLPCGDFPYTIIVTTRKSLIDAYENVVLDYMDEGIISVATLLKVFHTGGSKDEDNNRFNNLEKEGSYEKHFVKIYKELGSEDLTPIPVALLLKHPFIQDLINRCQLYKIPDIKIFLRRAEQAQSTDGQNTTCEEQQHMKDCSS
ncbi:hypothetical protein AV530_000305 [Patagioenas fasciata monilis]|uniref:SPEF2 C-terminal domain-containing protein n=1 Tax=Patagioenas fasciata monilis TaxID=372326 RepID=A0A1V4KDK7_PATFA|nr:hypothetical protein AV530_000305 [Patagioenas fasciata monilis]